MTHHTARALNYPIWAHSQYERERNGVRKLFDSLQEGDAIRVGSLKNTLEVIEMGDEELTVRTHDDYETTSYRLAIGDGRKYGLYLHREKSKTGVGEMAVIYRSDGSITKYTLSELVDLFNEGKKWEITHELATITVRAADPTAPWAENMSAIMEEQTTRKTAAEIDELVEEAEFETVTETAVMMGLPLPPQRGNAYDTIPGTVWFTVSDSESGRRKRVVPLDKINQIEVVEKD